MMSQCMSSRALNKAGKLVGAVLKSMMRNAACFTTSTFSNTIILARRAWKGTGVQHMMETSIGVAPTMLLCVVTAKTFTGTIAMGTSPKTAAPFACPAR